MSPRVLAVALLAQVLGGLTPVWTKLALVGLEPWTLVFARSDRVAAAARARARGSERRAIATSAVTTRDLGLLLLLSWAASRCPSCCWPQASRARPRWPARCLTPLEPIGIVLGSALWLSEGLPRARAIALALGTLGASLIVLQDGLRPDFGDALGDALIAAGHLSWAIYTLIAKSLLERHDEGRLSLYAVGLTLPPLALLASTESFDPARALPALGCVRRGRVLHRALHLALELGAAPAPAPARWRADLRQPFVGLAAGPSGSASAPARSRCSARW